MIKNNKLSALLTVSNLPIDLSLFLISLRYLSIVFLNGIPYDVLLQNQNFTYLNKYLTDAAI